MARTNTRFITTFNKMLGLLKDFEIADQMPSENNLATKLGVSRTVVRSVLARLDELGIIRGEGRHKELLRHPRADDQIEPPSELLTIDELEDQFLEWVLRRDVPPGTILNVAQLSKDFSVAAHTLQEFLTSLSRYGIVERRQKGGWTLHGFTTEFAVELSDFRALLELNAVKLLVEQPQDHPIWAQLDTLEADHRQLLTEIDTNFHDFSRLDERFHQAINAIPTNRFVTEFQKLISLIFHYHYQWNKSDEKSRNTDAIHEHLAYIDALRSRDLDRAQTAARVHLATSKQTLINSLLVKNPAF